MELIKYCCRNCGAPKLKETGEIIQCVACGTKYKAAVENKKITEEMRALADEIKAEHVGNLRRQLYEKATAEYIDSDAILAICQDLRSLLPDDFLARFYEVANSGTQREFADFLNSIDTEENAPFIESVVRFTAKSLTRELTLPIKNLIERAYKRHDLKQYVEIQTLVEAEAERVEAGVYDIAVDRDVFVVYSSKDMDKVMELVEALENEGLTCFVALRNLQHGRNAKANYQKSLETAMDYCKCIVFVSSKNSRNASCDACRVELPYIRSKDMQNVPYEYRRCEYSKIPLKYKKRRIEYLIEESTSNSAVERTVKEFFAGLEYCYTPEDVADRIFAFDSEYIDEPRDTEAAALRAQIEELKRQQEESRRQLEEAQRQTKPEAGQLDMNAFAEMFRLMEEEKAKAEAEKRKAEEEAKRKAENKAKRKTENEAKCKTENEAKCKTEEVPRQAELSRLKREFLQDSEIENGVLKKYTGSAKIVVIDDSVTEIGSYAFYKCTTITSITIPNSVTKIQQEAFSGCTNLTTITIPNNTTEIGSFAFSDCTKLKSIFIPKDVSTIEGSSFCGCTRLTRIDVDEENKKFKSIDGNLYSKNSKSGGVLVRYAPGKTEHDFLIPISVRIIGSHAFADCTNLTSITIPGGVIEIGWEAFYGCTNITSITIPDSVTKIDCRAFLGCTGLTSIKMSNSVTEIGESTFSDCTNLTSIIIPVSVVNIGALAFHLCKSLKTIKYCGSAEDWAKIEISSNGNDALKNVSFMKKSPQIPQPSPSDEFDKLTREILEMQAAREDALEERRKRTEQLKKEFLRDSVINNGVLEQYKGKAEVIVIDDSVTSINAKAFITCSNLRSITIPDSVTFLSSHYFSSCHSLEEIIVSNSNEKYKTIDGNLYSKDGRVLVRYADGNGYSNFEIPKGVELIDEGAFYNCHKLIKVIIPDSVKRINGYAFYNCTKLQSINIPNSVIYIGLNAFQYCPLLKEVTIPKSVASIGDRAFGDCPSIKIFVEDVSQISQWDPGWNKGLIHKTPSPVYSKTTGKQLKRNIFGKYS